MALSVSDSATRGVGNAVVVRDRNGKAALHRVLARQVERVSSLRRHSDMNGDVITLICHRLLLSRGESVMVSLNLRHVGALRHRAEGWKTKSTELVHDKSQAIGSWSGMLLVVGDIVRSSWSGRGRAQVGRVVRLANITSLRGRNCVRSTGGRAIHVHSVNLFRYSDQQQLIRDHATARAATRGDCERRRAVEVASESDMAR